MASALFTKKSFPPGSTVSDTNAEEKKNNDNNLDSAINGSDINPILLSPGAESLAGGDGVGGMATPAMSEISTEDQTSIISDAAIVMPSDGSGDPLINNSTALTRSRSSNNDEDVVMGDANNDTADGSVTCPKWSEVLSTPSNSSALFTPTSDISSLKSNLHGLGLKYSVDRSKVLSRTGKGCAALLNDIASLHEDLTNSLSKLCPTTLETAANGTPMENFANEVNRCVLSYINQTKAFGICVKNDISRPYHENSVNYFEESSNQYSNYTLSRGKCAQTRKEALKLRKKYLDSVKDIDVTINALRKARASKVGRKRKTTESSNEMSDRSGVSEGVEVYNSSASSWEKELREFGEKHSLLRQCEAVIRAAEEAKIAQANYLSAVAAENAAVDDAQDMERVALDAVQRLEEERIVVLIGLLDRFLHDQKESLENMSLDLTSAEPLDLEDVNTHKELHHAQSMVTTPTTPSSSIFMSPRRRAQSDDGPAINETRMLNLPDNIAEIRDNMKSLIGRLLSRLKTLKLVAAFNEGLASAIESFASNLKSQLENSPSSVSLNKNEGGNVLHAWNATMGSLEMYAKYAEMLGKQIRRGNSELQSILGSAEKEAKAFQEREEFRWKSLCDAARVETKAKMKHKQYTADLEKAKARVSLVEGEGGSPSEGGAGGDGDNLGSNSPMKSTSTKMDRHMNKAMGKMFSILPGGGEDVMSKVLTPQQRQAIATRQLDEAKSKKEKGTESFEVARSVKQQAVVSYETEAEANVFKFKRDERHEWDVMQHSLSCAVGAMRNFREGQLRSVLSSIDMVKGHLQGKALEDVSRWTAYSQKRVMDQRDRGIDNNDKKEEENGQSSSLGECGFSLTLQLVEGATDVQVRIRRFLDDEDVVMDEVDIVDVDDSFESSSSTKEADSGGDVNNDTPSSSSTPTKAPLLLPDVPPDSIIQKMDPIFSKKLKNVTIDTYYNAGWSEEIPLYEPWLTRKGSFDVVVGEWEQSDGGFENSWSGEKFPQKRVIKFKFKRTTHLYIGPPVAGVTQTQYLMKDGNDRCVVMMTVEMDGIPYSDSFAVEVRWAARRLKESDIAVDAGVFVRFIKSNMFANKIKSGTLKETSPIHLDLFEVIKSAIASSEGEGEGEEENLEVEEPMKETTIVLTETKEPEISVIETPSQIQEMINQFATAFLSLPQNQQLLLAFVVLFFITKMLFFRRVDSGGETIDDLSQKVDDLTNEVREMKAMLETILKLSAQSSSNQREEL